MLKRAYFIRARLSHWNGIKKRITDAARKGKGAPAYSKISINPMPTTL